MIIDWTAATKKEQIEFEQALRRAIARFCYFHRGGQSQLQRASKVSRTTIWRLCTGVPVTATCLQKIARVLPGWDPPARAAVSLKDHLAVFGHIADMKRTTGINDVRLHNAAEGKPRGVSVSQKARILAAYPGVIAPDSFDAHPDWRITSPPEQVETIQQMAAPNAPKPQAEDPPTI